MRGWRNCWTTAYALLPAPKVAEDPLGSSDSKRYLTG